MGTQKGTSRFSAYTTWALGKKDLDWKPKTTLNLHCVLFYSRHKIDPIVFVEDVLSSFIFDDSHQTPKS